MEQVEELKGRVKSLIVRQLKLEIDPATIKDDAPLFGDDPSGLGLDSIDALELALAIRKRYGVRTKADDAENRKIFSSVRALAEHVKVNLSTQEQP